jgi:opacity protein-like surface antigen
MVGWRFMPQSRWSPYIAVGAGSTSYREESDVAGLVETTSKSKFGFHAALGLDYYFGAVALGVEAMYSTVPNTIGEDGVSKVYGESDVGGATIVGKLSFGSSRP